MVFLLLFSTNRSRRTGNILFMIVLNFILSFIYNILRILYFSFYFCIYLVCPLGEFISNFTTLKCEHCPRGTYDDHENATECTPCPEGQTTDWIGAKTQTKCHDGKEININFSNVAFKSSFIEIHSCRISFVHLFI